MSGSFLVHDLLRLRLPARWEGAPAWVAESLERAPFAVVRRASSEGGKVPGGVRGRSRDERHAIWLEHDAIIATIRPEHLLCAALHACTIRVPALELLDRLKPVLAGLGLDWGPTGSVGYELASGIPTATARSDLDIVIRSDRRLPVGLAVELDRAIGEQARRVGCRVDALVEVPYGAISLAEYARRKVVMLRTPAGPCLTSDPWAAIMDS
ncbi:malonate decarboxylase holo-ACP synthase [Paraburkholderia sp. BCC1885]|uniref:malonate decarboxylase holo-ACP synthase n=1 Tax=Paraburkholderia sp. BCC1885 TaxID=2562669 RepID=UPI0011836AF9|nr:malonate decarboxylase holo-ACP synthase [Paraburkholderia sp. BCC1885]